MVKNAITVFARLKPEKSRKSTVNYKIHRRPEKHSNEDFLVLTAPHRSSEYIDNRPETWNFSFHRIFNHDVKQDDIFESVARPIVDSVFDGYNATILAYGQTGSGKTYTITGELGIHGQRGIIPRTLQYIFDVVRKNPENLYSVEIAYLEIYNENGYDLLLERKQREAASRLEDLPRVTIQEDENGSLHLKNLSFRIVESESEALRFLIDGDNYRAISETPMNPRSSRSHCIFTIIVSVKKFGSDRYSSAKMHLVDLAGSERVFKCAIQGTILTEAKHINLSLHFLEQVIVCLGQENVTHIPYRNSLLTSILRDSLGGNCLTTMLANLSVSNFNLEETISTCRFAQRVALVKNDVNLTFVLDTRSENKLLKMENEKLRKKIEELQKQRVAEIRCENSEIGSLEYYKNLVLQRDQEISRLIDILKKETTRKEKVIQKVTSTSTEISCEQKSTQIPSARISPQKNGPASPSRMKTRRKSINSLRTKSQMSPKSPEMLSRHISQDKKSQIMSPKCRIPKVPPLTLDDDKIEINDTDNSSKSRINRETSRIERNIEKMIEPKVESPELCVNHEKNFEKLLPIFQSPDTNITNFEKSSREKNSSEKKSPREKSGEKVVTGRKKNPSEEDCLEKEVSPEKSSEIFLEKCQKNFIDEKCLEKKSPDEQIAEKSITELRINPEGMNSGGTKSPREKSPETFFKKFQKPPREDQYPEAKKCPREKSPRFPQNVMKMIRTSCHRNSNEEEAKSPSTSKSETPRNAFKTSNIFRNILCLDKNSAPETNVGIDEISDDLQENSDDHRVDDFGKLPLTGDPEIDEEIIAFYRAKRGEGAF